MDKLNNRVPLEASEYKILRDLPGLYKVADKKELECMIDYFTGQFGYGCNLNWIDVSDITDMSGLFKCWDPDNDRYRFNGDISLWDVGNVTNMQNMFCGSHFNGDISSWNTSNVTNMQGMFKNSRFNGDISKWNISNVTNMKHMFSFGLFTGDISKWKINSHCKTGAIFSGCPIRDEHKPKFKVDETFDFGSVDKKKKHINIVDHVLPSILQKVRKYIPLT